MARIRSIYPEACESKRLASLSDGAERTFWRLQVHCDDEGRTKAEPELLRSRMYVYGPHKANAVARHLNELEDKRYIVRYEVDGKLYLQFLDWKQNPQHPSMSKLPKPPENAFYGIPHEDSDICIPRVGVGEGVDKGDGVGGDFQITDALKEWASKNGCEKINLDAETEKFLDHHRSKGSIFKDWNAAWRKWMRNARDWNTGKPNHSVVAGGARIPPPAKSCDKCTNGFIENDDGSLRRCTHKGS